jgi:sugar lactone lactonase YvrE
VETLATGFTFLEAPRYDGDGGLYFVDESSIYHLRGDGEIGVLDSRPAGGLLLHRDGGLVVSGTSLIHLQSDGSRRELLALPDAEWINDIHADEEGRVYCGVVPTGPVDDAGCPPPGGLWRISDPGRADLLYEDIGFPNGIGFSPDGSLLYQCDTVRREIIVHDMSQDAPSAGRRLSTAAVPGGPDGLAVDQEGCLWVAMFGGGCVVRFTSTGTLEQVLELPAVNVTSVTFGGSANDELYIVTCDNTQHPELAGCIYRTTPPVAGIQSPRAVI